ncbi:MAG TPA: sodium:alanine symporter family protein [Eubacterium sp.]|nr:sodium:alanine symporter family protein [Eubacterium sp.]
MKELTSLLQKIDDIVWGLPLIIIIMATGLFLTIRLRGLQIRKLGKAFKLIFSKEEGEEGEVSSFGALCTALSATIGTGNIVGVATAIGILAGGPGALFWMWIAALLGMATKYAEGFLAIKYRHIDENGHVLGGPFYYIEKGMGQKWKWLAKIFAIFGSCVALFGIGTFTQVSGIANSAKTIFDPNLKHTVSIFGHEYSWAVIIVAIVVTIAVALVVIGGIKRIAMASEVIVPFMAGLYIISVVALIICNITKLPAAIGEIFSYAFGFKALAGGAFASIAIAMQRGVARGIFSNEAGLGSAPIAAAAAKTKEPTRQGLISMLGTFIDTVVVCTMTGLAIVITGVWKDKSSEGVEVTIKAFQKGLTFIPNEVAAITLMVCLIFFAFTSIIGWNYYGERCVEYLTNKNKYLMMAYRCAFIAAIFIGPYLMVTVIWTIADIFNGLMAIPNIIAILVLSPIIVAGTREYLNKSKK